MSEELLEYKCPACGGALEFDSKLQALKCPFCDSKYSVEELKEKDIHLSEEKGEADDSAAERPDNMNWDVNVKGEWSDAESDSVKVYVCQSCGGEIISDENTAATSCPFCGNPVVISGNLQGQLKPEIVIPFKLDKAAAKKALSNHLCKKRLLPKVFKGQNHIDEVKGVYVPYWLFDADADANIKYHATKTRVWSDSDYDYTETKHFSVLRGGTLKFENIPADGSSKMPDDLMESIEPYNMADAVDFQTAYLAGFFADKYDIDASETIERVNERAKKTVESSFLSTVKKYDSVITESSSISLNKSSVRYALLPVWLLHTSWRGQNYLFAMNGQTGKFVGNLPLDKGAYWKWWGISAAIFAAAAFAVSCFLFI